MHYARSGKDQTGPVLGFTAEAWTVFTAALKAQEHHPQGHP